MSSCTSSDNQFMSRALSRAWEVKGSTHPNPAVGAVVVLDGLVKGEGKTAPCGGPHAEVGALRQAGSSARGANLYVTLEPCCHYGRTPPCTRAIIEAGIRRVVVAHRDPFEAVAGRGIAQLRRAGITVDVGVCRQEAARINEDYFWSVRTQRPWVSLKLALTMDGRVADLGGCSQWITGVASRRVVQELRRQHSAVAVGWKTLVADTSRLTIRTRGVERGTRVVFAGRTPRSAHCAFVGNAPRVRSIIVRPGGEKARKESGEDGTQVWFTGCRTRLGSFRSFLRMAHEDGMRSVLIEGGAVLGSTILEAGLVNRIHLFYAPVVLGGGVDGLRFHSPRALSAALRFTDIAYRQLGNDVMMTALCESEG